MKPLASPVRFAFYFIPGGVISFCKPILKGRALDQDGVACGEDSQEGLDEQFTRTHHAISTAAQGFLKIL